jgi:uncharacterized membrane protein
MMIGMMSFGLVVPLLLIALVAYVLAWRPQFNQTGTAQDSEPPLEILKARHERGEISHEEYEQIRRDLED